MRQDRPLERLDSAPLPFIFVTGTLAEAMHLNDLIKERKLTQTAVAEIFGIPQPHISELRNYKLSRFSSERLLHFITQLDRDVEIVIRPKAANHAAG
jgi:predicted XRE-type DNA-binding protein